ncbi:3'-5' exonuclease [Marinobacter hydrocarbonoclasticus]|nr:3'-5' exonuclease [Marinobacter nauticus]
MPSRLRFGLARWRNSVEAFSPFFDAGSPRGAQDYREIEMLALDLELTGLDVKQDAILSIACVPIIGGRLVLAEAWHQLVNIDGGVGQSATIHGIHDRHLEGAMSLKQALSELLPRLSGRVLVCHHGGLDLGFLQSGLQAHFGQGLPLDVVDTLQIEQRRLQRQGTILKADTLKLAQCRRRYGLPDYPGHNALTDAIACGELLLAQASALAGRGRLSLAELLSLSR